MSWLAIIIAIVFAVIAWKVLMGLLRVGAIIAILVIGYVLFSQGLIA